MRPGLKMLAATTARSGGESRGMDYGRSDGREGRMDYRPRGGMEGGYEDRSYNRSGYNVSSDMGMEYGPDNRGRRRYSDGRFAPRNAEQYTVRREIEGQEGTYLEPIYTRMNTIGFNAGGGHAGNVVPFHGRASGKDHSFTREMAEDWMEGLHNADGTTGPHWTMDQTRQVMNQAGRQYDPIRFWVALNATYSDLCGVAKKHGLNSMDYYVDVAVANWLEDEDAVEDKLAAYYLCVTNKKTKG